LFTKSVSPGTKNTVNFTGGGGVPIKLNWVPFKKKIRKKTENEVRSSLKTFSQRWDEVRSISDFVLGRFSLFFWKPPNWVLLKKSPPTCEINRVFGYRKFLKIWQRHSLGERYLERGGGLQSSWNDPFDVKLCWPFWENILWVRRGNKVNRYDNGWFYAVYIKLMKNEKILKKFFLLWFFIFEEVVNFI